MLGQALKAARAARGTDDSNNDWLTEPEFAGQSLHVNEPHSTDHHTSDPMDPSEELEVEYPNDFKMPSRDQAAHHHQLPQDRHETSMN